MGYGESAFAGVRMIEGEREHQYYDNGFKDEHDDQHTKGELIRAANCYMMSVYFPNEPMGEVMWPWRSPFKPYDDPLRNLAAAGALIAAEIDRRERLRNSQAEDVK